jgi:FkbM family methyltransferase
MGQMTVRRGGCAFNVADDPAYQEFWGKYDGGGWEPDTLNFIGHMLSPGDFYVDIGSWIGPTVLFAAAKGAHTLAFEPDNVAFEALTRNVDLNPALKPSLSLINAAVSDKNGPSMFYDPGDTFGFSTSSLFAFNKSTRFGVAECLDAEEVFEQFARRSPKLVKIDVEGGEYRIIPRLSKTLRYFRPTLLISMHPFVFKDAPDVLLESMLNLCNVLKALEGYSHIYLLNNNNLIPINTQEILTKPAARGNLVFSDRPL